MSEIPPKISRRVMNVNIATLENGAKVISGHDTFELLTDDSDYQNEAYHLIGDKTGITVDLGQISCFNHIKFKINAWCCYYIEISRDRQEWQRLVDYSNFQCHSWQRLFFPEQAGKYIRLVVTKGPIGIKNFKVFLKESIPEVVDQIVRATQNVATEEMDTVVQQRTNNSDYKNELDFKSNWVINEGHCAQIWLAQPYVLSTIKIATSSQSRYGIQTSIDYSNWDTVVDRKNSEGLEIYKFPEKVVTGIRIQNQASTDLVCLSFECF